MIVINKIVNAYLEYNFDKYSLEDILFFDIETTGFSYKNSQLYLIGGVYFKEGNFRLVQWFADSRDSEENIICAFFNFLNSFKVLVHFNGNGFDIPYLKGKCEQFNLNYNFDNIESFDIYKVICSYKKIFNFENYKLKSIEDFLGIQRDDKYNGGELIKVYKDYLKCSDSPAGDTLKGLLLLHNSDDIEGMLKIACILNYTDIFSGNVQYDTYSVNKYEDDMVINFNHSLNIPVDFSYSSDIYSVKINSDNIIVTIQLYTGELKYFYSDYKNYYYLPYEDTAIHKSVAEYVDSSHKVKCKADNCYTRKTGVFIPISNSAYRKIKSVYSENIHMFSFTHKDKTVYIEYDESIVNSDVFVNNILSC